MHTSPSLFSRKFIPPFSLLLIGLIALLVKCWDLLLQRFETAPCNVYLPDMAEIGCLHHTWCICILGLGFGPEGWIGNIPKLGKSSKEPEGSGCPTPVEIFHILSWNTHRIMELLRLGNIFGIIKSNHQPPRSPLHLYGKSQDNLGWKRCLKPSNPSISPALSHVPGATPALLNPPGGGDSPTALGSPFMVYSTWNEGWRCWLEFCVWELF